jgi:hypothetical protein
VGFRVIARRFIVGAQENSWATPLQQDLGVFPNRFGKVRRKALKQDKIIAGHAARLGGVLPELTLPFRLDNVQLIT